MLSFSYIKFRMHAQPCSRLCEPDFIQRATGHYKIKGFVVYFRILGNECRGDYTATRADENKPIIS